ncbi:MAG: 30S ribosomal protein S20 [Candidatus Azambacteria bacterium GW2011_GWE1_42_9]|nr:MAG: 30S ribosomal protein S20 [Candidatus Azambacteria bacterium GW2011_GWF1_41_10]KKS49375.1 MAG: 30S ribosomal protein S20 [Candidatus Azambacteria bacterium GW2011_GWF2_42_22]KKS68829.1 MAG: 30S ribosomal protein S20 [Candidatus Azambacteria bacterium GW2011_GWA2_42_62]KKS73504.1 MAG: 30S ribosomal protein S20 [Candidatus Azambacteria bacterium GW2011_GWB1_42_72]KKS79593.1 MAG: 30S ribosomal protein S20 [Candidatus Azambacteria bacterium GW2011_GWE1_42_9]KKT03486.1 MAG: 30S ribosomal pr
MPITKSAEKALRQNKRRHIRNVKQSRSLKDEVKSLKKLVIAKDKKGAGEALPKVYKALDKAAKNNLIKKNTASRMKSRLTKTVNKL